MSAKPVVWPAVTGYDWAQGFNNNDFNNNDKKPYVTDNNDISSLLQELCLNIALLNESTELVHENAMQSLMLSNRAKNTALEGGNNIRKMVEYIDAIRLSKSDTNNITKIILNIIRKTRLLATNARIEAARLGDEGRRFNIVAEEMNNLSSKTERVVDQIHSVMDITIEYVSQAAAHAHIASDKLELLETSEGLVFSFLNELTESIVQQTAQMKAFTQHTDSLIARNVSRDDVLHFTADILTTLERFKQKTISVRESTQQVHMLVNNVSASAHDCILQLQQMIGSVQQINNSSTSINKLIRDIHIVTDDTILLSLNAKIEAARIGTQGGAFMVIADEMRLLVLTTDKAISKINDVLQETIRHAEVAISTSSRSEELIEMLEVSDQLISSLMDTFAPSVESQMRRVNSVNNTLQKYRDPKYVRSGRESLSDKRHYVRYKLGSNAMLTCNGGSISGKIGDISLGGMFILAQQIPNTWVNQPCKIIFTPTIQGSQSEITLQANITFITQRGAGLQFSEQDNQNKLKLNLLIAHLRQGTH